MAIKRAFFQVSSLFLVVPSLALVSPLRLLPYSSVFHYLNVFIKPPKPTLAVTSIYTVVNKHLLGKQKDIIIIVIIIIIIIIIYALAVIVVT